MFWSGDKLSPTTHTPSERPRRLEAATYPIQIPDRLPSVLRLKFFAEVL
jgi:hypothetical protein